MYSYISGILKSKQNEYLVVEAGGIGYRIFTALTTVEAAGEIESEIKVYTHLHIREDIMNLYGFLTQEELKMFEMLISVSGVGPKAAISMISSVPPSKFGVCVITNDCDTLTKAQGIGGKTAQRIILELKDKIKKEQLSLTDVEKGSEITFGKEDSKYAEAVSALMVLGYTSVEAKKAITTVYKEDSDLENIIKMALRNR